MDWEKLGSTEVRLLALLGRIHKEIFDVFPPHGPILLDRFASVALNPQPLPPGPDPLVAGAAMASRLANQAIDAYLAGDDSRPQWLDEIIEEWCGTPWPRRFPLPWPPDPEGGPFPDPWDVASARAAGALVFASLATRFGGDEMSLAFRDASQRLAETAAQGAG
ncbi:hypothetical protein [Agromyces sp. ZXT2-3]|uniref:hypothetical protein n=1 Tax=Agromyces sp. ZXT2-3 TaxID=3461152 RepID=UPI0040552DED